MIQEAKTNYILKSIGADQFQYWSGEKAKLEAETRGLDRRGHLVEFVWYPNSVIYTGLSIPMAGDTLEEATYKALMLFYSMAFLGRFSKAQTASNSTAASIAKHHSITTDKLRRLIDNI